MFLKAIIFWFVSRKQHLSQSDKEKLIVSGSVNLISVSGHNLDRAVGRFCRLNWSAQKIDPAKGETSINKILMGLNTTTLCDIFL